MATYQVSGPGGAVYRIEGPEGADPSAIIGAIGGLVGHAPLVGKYLRGVNDFVDQRVNEALANAMLDPQKAAAMLLKGQPRVPWWIALARAARTRKLAPYLAGPAATLPGTVTLPPAFPGAIPQRINGLVGMR